MLRFGQRRSHGFTLLEVLLALSLTVVLMGILTITIQVYLKASNAGRDEVEQAQLARVLLRRISDDLRSTIWHNDVEEAAASSTDSAASSASGGASSGSGATSGSGAASGSGGSTSGSGASTGSGGPSGSSGSGTASDSNSSSVSDSTELPPALGLFGNQYEIQVDVSRLPRIEQYAAATTTATDIVSDVKTVAYFCQVGSTAANSTTPGLARREFDRAVTSYASTNGDLSAWESGLAPIAQEVAAIEFQYWDGTTWVNEWDSQDKKALPAAVKIALKLSTAVAAEDTSFFSTSDGSSAAAAAETIYYLTVFIPQSQAPKLAGASAMETMVSATANQAANSAAGGSAAGGQSGQQPGGAQGGGSSGRGGGYGPGGAPGGDGGGGGRGGGGGGGGRGGGGGPDGGDGGGPPPGDDDDDDGGG
jgi:prepilin-type N-terminal cleavage/methylation domain-containing protein